MQGFLFRLTFRMNGWQSQKGTGSVASIRLFAQTRLPATVPVPFLRRTTEKGARKKGTGTVAVMVFADAMRICHHGASPLFP